MAHEVKVPQMGESVLEGTIIEWKVKEGDRVKVNDPLVEIMTDKVNVEIPAEVEGVIEKIAAQPDEVVQVGNLLCIISTDGAAPAKKAEKPEETAEVKPAPQRTAPAAEKPVPKRPAGDKPKMAPAVRKKVRDYGLDPNEIEGTGPEGRITADDVENAARARSGVSQVQPEVRAAAPAPAREKPVSAPQYTPPRFEAGERLEERVPVAGARKMISEHMIKSKATSAHVTTFEDCDFTSLVEFRNEAKEQFLETYGVKLTYMPFIMKAAVECLKDFPAINASMTDKEIIYKKYYHIGFAVARENGLIVPVIKDADRKSIVDLAVEMNDLSDRARNDQLTLDQVQGGTFTLTNAGMFGATASTPVINQPQVAILGIHNIAKKPVVRDDQIVIRYMSTFGMSFDHRLIDGHTAVQFLHKLIGYLEDLPLLLTRLR